MALLKPKRTEVDNSVARIVNLVRLKGIVLPEEIDNITADLSKAEKQKALAKLKSMGYEFVEDMIKFKDEVTAEEKITDNEIFSYLVKPEYVDTSSDSIQVGSQVYKGIVATGFPSQVSDNWMGKLTQESGNVDFSIFIEPSSVRALEIYLNNQLKKVENDLYKYESRGVSNPSLVNRKKELLEQLNNLIQGTYKLYKMILYLAAKGPNKEKANSLTTKITSLLHAEGIEAKQTTNYQQQLLKSIIPTSINHLKGREIFVPGPAAAASFPFSSAFYEVDEEDGIFLGFNDNNIPIGMSLWKLPKYVGVVIGASGSGKSYSSKALILNDRMVNGTKTFILDPENEYTDMCKVIENSQVISLDRHSKSIPNLLSLFGGNLTDKLVSLPKIFDVLLGGLSENQKPILETALIDTYKKKGITEDKESSWSRAPPKLSDLVATLRKNMKSCRGEAMKSDYEIIIGRLSRYTTGVFKFMNRGGEGIDVKKDFTVFEFKSMPEEVRPVLMLILLEFIKTKFLQDKNKKMLVMDEAWRVLKNKNEADYIESFARTFRKSNGALLLITQSVAELQDSPEGKAYLANTAFQLVLRTEGIVADETCKLFSLNKREKEVILNARQGQGILVWGGKHFKINVRVDPKTHDLITTNPEEIKRLNEHKKKEAEDNNETKNNASVKKKSRKR